MSKFSKVVISLFIITVITVIGLFAFMQFSGSSEATAFNQGEEVDLDATFQTYEIGDDSVGYINELKPFDCVEKKNGCFVFKNNNDYVFFIDMNQNHDFLSKIVPGSADVYTNEYIKDLPSSLNANSRLVLNNLYSNHMKVEKLLIGEDNKAVIVNGADLDGTLGHVLKQQYNIQRDDDIQYCFFSTNILIVTMQDDIDEIDSVSTYHKVKEAEN